MKKYQVELNGTIDLDAEDALDAENIALDLLHGDLPPWDGPDNIDLHFVVIETKEID